MKTNEAKNAISTEGIRHIAFIMDGNGRWAKKRLMPREKGHVAGAKKFKEIVRYLSQTDIECVTVYAFSTENWKRPKNEVNAIMGLLRDYIDEAEKEFQKNEVCVRFIGNRAVFDNETKDRMARVEQLTSIYKKTVCIAVNYGGKAEIIDAVNTLIAEGKTSITEDDITKTIYSGIVPPPDMIVRTGGECRLSNFLLWQSAYAELFFTNTLWPDLSTDEIDEMIREFQSRNRRYGGI